MDVSREGVTRCKRCQSTLTEAQEVCPTCDYHPKQRGLRLALGCLLIMVFAMIGAQLSLLVSPVLGLVLVGAAGVAFLASFALFFLSMVATPHRFGALFLRF